MCLPGYVLRTTLAIGCAVEEGTVQSLTAAILAKDFMFLYARTNITYLLEDPQALPLQGERQGRLWTTRYSLANGDYLAYPYPLSSVSPMPWSWVRVAMGQVGSMPSTGWRRAM